MSEAQEKKDGAVRIESAPASDQAENSRATNPWSCQFQPFDTNPSFPLDQWEVGRKYLLHCEGEFVEGLKAPVFLKWPDEKWKYSLKVLDLRSFDNNNVWLEVTAYKPGKFSVENIVITDGTNEIPVSLLEWNVASVLASKQQEMAQNPEEQKLKYVGPFELALPLWYWVAWGLLAFLIIGLFVHKVRKYLERKRLIERLSRQTTALTPYNQFNKEIREHMRKYQGARRGEETKEFYNHYLENLDETFRMFLVRELLVPAMDWSSSAVLREIKLRHKNIYKYTGPQIRRLLTEFDRAKRDRENATFEDCEQLREMSRRVADQLFKIRRVQK